MTFAARKKTHKPSRRVRRAARRIFQERPDFGAASRPSASRRTASP